MFLPSGEPGAEARGPGAEAGAKIFEVADKSRQEREFVHRFFSFRAYLQKADFGQYTPETLEPD
jgi:hypothetical protein